MSRGYKTAFVLLIVAALVGTALFYSYQQGVISFGGVQPYTTGSVAVRLNGKKLALPIGSQTLAYQTKEDGGDILLKNGKFELDIPSMGRFIRLELPAAFCKEQIHEGMSEGLTIVFGTFSQTDAEMRVDIDLNVDIQVKSAACDVNVTQTLRGTGFAGVPATETFTLDMNGGYDAVLRCVTEKTI